MLLEVRTFFPVNQFYFIYYFYNCFIDVIHLVANCVVSLIRRFMFGEELNKCYFNRITTELQNNSFRKCLFASFPVQYLSFSLSTENSFLLSLYTFDGVPITDGNELENGQFYVAVGRDKFKRLPYSDLLFTKPMGVRRVVR